MIKKRTAFNLILVFSLFISGCSDKQPVDNSPGPACPKSSDLVRLDNIYKGASFTVNGHKWSVYYAQGHIALEAIDQLHGPIKITDVDQLKSLGIAEQQSLCQYTRNIFGKVHALLYIVSGS